MAATPPRSAASPGPPASSLRTAEVIQALRSALDAEPGSPQGQAGVEASAGPGTARADLPGLGAWRLTKVIIQADNLAALGASCSQVVAVVGLAAERVARDLRDRRVLKRARERLRGPAGLRRGTAPGPRESG